MFANGGFAGPIVLQPIGDYQIRDLNTGEILIDLSQNPDFINTAGFNPYKILYDDTLEKGPAVLSILENFQKRDAPKYGPFQADEDYGTNFADLAFGAARLTEGPIRGLSRVLGEVTGIQAAKDFGGTQSFDPTFSMQPFGSLVPFVDLFKPSYESYVPTDADRARTQIDILKGTNRFGLEDPKALVTDILGLGYPFKQPNYDPVDYEDNLTVEDNKEISDLLDEIKPIEQKVDLDKTEEESASEVEEKFGGLPESEIKDLLEPIKPIDPIVAATTGEEEKIEQDEDQPPPLPRPIDPITRKLEEPGFFGSDRFLDFIRNVGGELTRTGQMGTGLSLGASKAAEERAARELMAEQEEKEFASKLRLARAEAALEGTGFMDPTDANKIVDQENALADNIQSFEKSRSTLSNLNKVIGILDEGGATGLKGFFGEATDMIEAAIKSDTGKSFEDLEPRTRANSLLKVLRQANVREILGESGKTISNLDRQIVEEVFGDIKFGTPVAVSIKKLEDSRKNILNGMMSTQNKIINSRSFFDNIGYDSNVLRINQPILDLIKAFTFSDAESYIAPDTSDAGIIDTTLATD